MGTGADIYRKFVEPLKPKPVHEEALTR